MRDKRMLTIAISVGVLAIAGGRATSAQDKYTVKVPGGLAFSEFRGYEAWQAISMSRNEKAVAVILGNPAMIDAIGPVFPATVSLSRTGPRWLRSIGLRNRTNSSRTRQCRAG